jgi:hypothetical protein
MQWALPQEETTHKFTLQFQQGIAVLEQKRPCAASVYITHNISAVRVALQQNLGRSTRKAQQN